MRRELVIAEFLSTPWAMERTRMANMVGVVARWAEGMPKAMQAEDLEQAKGARAARRQSNARAGGGAIAVLPLYGVITQRGNMMDDLSGPGSTSTQMFAQAFREAMADETVGAVIIDVDSPGGSVYGVQELAQEIYQARAKKQIVAVANSLAASAAYWVGAAASEFYVTPGGEVGSIGVWSAHEDWSKYLEEVGVKTTLISAGKYKTEGNPYGPLDPDAMGFQQSRVNDYYNAFTQGVSRFRGQPIASVRDGMGQGRVVGADQAVSEKMVDGVMTFDDAVKKTARGMKDARKASARELRERDF